MILKVAHTEDVIIKTTLPVMEHFYTLQGEGFHQGKAAYFIRLGGCDVGCVWCDVKESWDGSKFLQYDTQDLLNIVKATQAEIVVITGGEPLLHDLSTLTKTLRNEGLKSHIEEPFAARQSHMLSPGCFAVSLRRGH